MRRCYDYLSQTEKTSASISKWRIKYNLKFVGKSALHAAARILMAFLKSEEEQFDYY